MKLLISVCFVIISAIIWQEASADCVVPGAPAPLKSGESFNPIGNCMRLTCDGSGVNGIGCGLMQPRRGCRMSGEDKTKPYPHCCPREIC